jgi:hypothetical protein
MSQAVLEKKAELDVIIGRGDIGRASALEPPDRALGKSR